MAGGLADIFILLFVRTKLEIYNSLEQEVNTLIDRTLGAGKHQVSWAAQDRNGNKLSSGIYIYLLRASSFTKAMKMVLLR